MLNLSSAARLDAAAFGIDVSDVDSWVSARRDGDRIALVRESGAIDHLTVTAVGQGVVRVRSGAGTGESSMLSGAAETALPVVADGDSLTAGHGAIGLRVTSDAHLQLGALASTSGDGSMGGSGLRPGALTADGDTTGWLARFAMTPTASVFGGGGSVQGPQLRGRTRVMRNVETSGFTAYDRAYLNVPFIWSPEGWGLLVHTGGTVTMDIGDTAGDVLSVMWRGGELDLFVFEGTPHEILSRYHRVTGEPGTVPGWALGTWMSRCSYFSEAEIHQMLDEAEAAGCRIDVVHVDAWQTGEVLVDLACNWEPDTRRFPSGWVGRLRERGVRVSLWHNPYIPAESAAAREAAELGLFASMPDGSVAESADIPGRLLLDLTNPATLAWWHEKITTLVGTEEVAAIKTDFGEEVPDEAVFADGRRGWQIRNEYAHLYQRASSRALVAALPEGEAPVMFVRSGTTGSQQYPCHWVGDSASTWGGMVAALRSALSMSLSGFAWVSHDVGGFWVAGSDAHMRASRDGDPSHYTADVDPELYLRWTQWGVFSPVLRFHGAGRREPFAYPAPFGSLAVAATRVREALREYLELCARRTAQTGLPVMRPMALAFPERTELHDRLQYVLGEDIVVAPVLQSGGAVTVWLPEGKWRTLIGGRVFDGGWHTVQFDLDDFPAFVRDDVQPGWLPAFHSTLHHLTDRSTVEQP
jgi:alpha-D-xyloside xylohydrolase